MPPRLFSALLIQRPQQQPDGPGERVPFRLLAHELLSAETRDAVVAGAFPFVGSLPGRGHPAIGFESIKRRVERTGFNLQQVFRRPPNVFGNGMTVARTRLQGAQDEKIERASQELESRGLVH